MHLEPFSRTRSFVWPVAAAALALSLAGATAAAQGRPLVERVWYDGDTERKVWMATDEIAVIFKPGRIPATAREAERLVRRSEPRAVLERRQGAVAYFVVRDSHESAAAHARAVAGEPDVEHASPVFYQSSTRSSPMALTGQIIVGFKSPMTDAGLKAFAGPYGLTFVKSLDVTPATYIFDTPDTHDSLDVANRIYRSGQVRFAQPNWVQSAVRR